MISQLIQKVDNAIQSAITDTSKLEGKHFKIEGMSKNENRILLNELLNGCNKYLEVGVHKGSTFVSALFNNNVPFAYAIDNFSQFGDANSNKKWFEQNCADSNINYTLIEKDCFNLSADEMELLKNTEVYFYDGDHKKEDQSKAFSYFHEILAKEFIIIIDDYNHKPVQEGTEEGKQFLNSVGSKIHKEWILDTRVGDKKWHNGLYIAVVEKQ